MVTSKRKSFLFTRRQSFVQKFFAGYVIDGYPSLDEEFVSIREQLELIKQWKMKPDFIINLKVGLFEV